MIRHGLITGGIVTYNRFSDTVRCVESLRTGEVVCDHVVIVDNGSTDGTYGNLVRQFNGDQGVTILSRPANGGFAAGVNACLAESSRRGSEYVVIINDDAQVDPQCLQYLVREVGRSPRYAMGGPAILYQESPEKVWQGGGMFSMLRGGVAVVDKNKSYAAISKSPRSVGFLSGCVLLIRTDVLKETGLFDEDYFMYAEDTDFCLRVRRAGHEMVYVPEAKAFHKISGRGVGRASSFALYHIARSTVLLYGKSFPGLYKWYGFMIQLLLYTPLRIWQMIKAGAGLSPLGGWLIGLLDGFFKKPPRRLP